MKPGLVSPVYTSVSGHKFQIISSSMGLSLMKERKNGSWFDVQSNFGYGAKIFRTMDHLGYLNKMKAR